MSARTPNADKSVVVSVQVGQPRAGGFHPLARRRQVRHARLGCAPGTTVTFTVPNMGIDPLTIKARTVNTGGRSPARRRATRSSPTARPSAQQRHRPNSRTIIWRWDLRTNGRAIDQVQIRIDGGSWRAPDNRESHSQSFGYSEEPRARGARAQRRRLERPAGRGARHDRGGARTTARSTKPG